MSKSADDSYFEEGAARARALPNRGPLRFDAAGNLAPDILAAYWRYGFYVLEGVVTAPELDDLRRDYQAVVERAPTGPGAAVDAHGRAAIGADRKRPTFMFARPLSDPMGATNATNGRYPVKMAEGTPPEGAPAHVLLQINGCLELMDSCLRLYGHPRLLAVAEVINGPDFTPFTDTIWVKPAGLGAAVSWHQDGTTLWNHPQLDGGTHGFNFMAQLYRTTPRNALWIVPESHDVGKIDIRARIAANGGSDHLPDAVPLLCEAGDVAVCNRQMLHCSFPNSSPDLRVTFVFGFHRRASIDNAAGWDFQGKRPLPYDAERIFERSRIVALAVDARRQRFPGETPYSYQPMRGHEDENRWDDHSRIAVLKDYNLRDLGI